MIGKVHPLTVPAVKILEREGLQDSSLVSIIEPGPFLMGKVAGVRTVQKSAVAEVLDFMGDDAYGEEYIISNGKFGEFRSCLGHVQQEKGKVLLSPEVGKALQLERGDRVRFVRLRE